MIELTNNDRRMQSDVSALTYISIEYYIVVNKRRNYPIGSDEHNTIKVA